MSLVFDVHYPNESIKRAVEYVNLRKKKIKIGDTDLEITNI